MFQIPNLLSSIHNSGALSIFILMIIFPLLIPYHILGSDETDIKFQVLTATDGLSQNTVNCILQDHLGYMWFGTEDGLNRYDGYEIQTYYSDPVDERSLSHNLISAIFEDKDRNLWIGTIEGLDKFNRAENNFDRIASLPVTSICQANDSILWVGSENGLYRFNSQTNQIELYSDGKGDFHNLSDKDINSVRVDKTGKLWVGTSQGGLNKIDKGNGRFVHYLHQENEPNSLSINGVIEIFEDSFGKLWFGTNGGGLDYFDRRKQSFIHHQNVPGDPTSLSNDVVRSICEDRDGNLWVATDDGINKFDRNNQKFTCFKHDPNDPYSLSHKRTSVIYQDRTGSLWVGTTGGGVNKFDPHNLKFSQHQLTTDDKINRGKNIVWCFHKDKLGNLWVGTGMGLFKIENYREGIRKGSIKYYATKLGESGESQVRAICEDASGALWIGILQVGIAKFDPKSEKFIYYRIDRNNKNSLPNENIYDLIIDQQGILWAATNGGGLIRLDPVRNQFKNYDCKRIPDHMTEGWVMDIYDHEDHLWLGTWESGLVRFDKQHEAFTYYHHDSQNPNSLDNDKVLCIHEDKQDILWVGTYGGGLNKFDRKKKSFVRYTVKKGLANNVIFGIEEDQSGNLWLSTNKGLTRFDPRSESFRNYDVRDGLRSTQFNLGAHFKNSKGKLFFGTAEGFTSFYPEYVINSQPPLVLLTAFKKSGQRIHLNDPLYVLREIEMSYKDNAFSFEFVGFHYKDSAKNQYAYKMEGFDKGWNYVGERREAIYTNLDPGNYTFKVKAANCDGVWNEEGVSVSILIKPPFWKTGWFYVLTAITLFLMTFALYRLHIREVLKIERAKMEERENILKKITADFHDELGHRVTKISLLSKIIRRKLNHASPVIEEQLDKVIENSDRLFREMKEFIWEIDPEKESVYDLAVQLKNFSDQLFDDTDIAFQLKTLSEKLEDIKLPLLWRQHLLRIFKEGMHNILKHAGDCRNVFLEITYNDSQLEFRLADDGKGFDPGDHPMGRGIGNMKERAEKIKASFSIDSKSGVGTMIILRLNLP